MITTEKLRNAWNRSTYSSSQPRSSREAKSWGFQTIFLSHSHSDQALALGLAQMMREAGCSVYIDWLDQDMPDRPNRETAARIKAKIAENDYFMFLATETSMKSRWCPWEIGYADGVKKTDNIIIIPTKSAYSTHGSEYLDLYRRLVIADDGELAIFDPGKNNNGQYARSL